MNDSQLNTKLINELNIQELSEPEQRRILSESNFVSPDQWTYHRPEQVLEVHDQHSGVVQKGASSQERHLTNC